jgi:hypothetical protein
MRTLILGLGLSLGAAALVACGETVSVGGPLALDAAVAEAGRACPGFATTGGGPACTDPDSAARADVSTDASVDARADASSCAPDTPDDCSVIEPTWFGVVLATCAPADGPAEQFYFSPDAGCGTSPGGDGARDTLSITIYSEISGPGTFSFAPAGANGQGVAQSCTVTRGCLDAVHITLTLTTFTDTAGRVAAGSYSIDLSDGTTVALDFSAPICKGAALCG